MAATSDESPSRRELREAGLCSASIPQLKAVREDAALAKVFQFMSSHDEGCHVLTEALRAQTLVGMLRQSVRRSQLSESERSRALQQRMDDAAARGRAFLGV